VAKHHELGVLKPAHAVCEIFGGDAVEVTQEACEPAGPVVDCLRIAKVRPHKALGLETPNDWIKHVA